MKNIFYYFIIITISISSCKKKCQEPNREKPTLDCVHIPPASSLLGYDHVSDEKGKLFPYFNPNNGYEFGLALLAISVALAIHGGGKYSLDQMISRKL